MWILAAGKINSTSPNHKTGNGEMNGELKPVLLATDLVAVCALYSRLATYARCKFFMPYGKSIIGRTIDKEWLRHVTQCK